MKNTLLSFFLWAVVVKRFSGSEPCIQGNMANGGKFEMGKVHLVVIPQPLGKGGK